MNVLFIGNSFSQDSTRYLHGIARADGVNIKVVNIYIGGCSLERHYRNMLSEARAYELEYNGERTGFYVSLKEALLNRAWDVVSIQQASFQSTRAETFRPYASELAEFIRKCVPTAKILLHQTWAYEKDSDKLRNFAGYESPEEMLRDIVNSYDMISREIGADGIVPAGETLGNVLKLGVSSVHRDTYHASRGIGRYALALLWYRMLSGKTTADNCFSDFDEPVSEKEIEIIKSYIDSVSPIFEKI